MSVDEPSDTSKNTKSNGKEKVTNNVISCQRNKSSDRNVLNKLTKALNVEVNKPLLPLKMTLFCWFAAAAVLKPFTGLYLKQLGLSLENLSIIYIILPFIQFLGPTLSGVIADKLGRSKPVLQANLLLVIIASNAMLFIPGLKSRNCNQAQIQCHSEIIDDTTTANHCDIQSNDSNAFNHCTFQCSLDQRHELDNLCFQNYISLCGVISKYESPHNIYWPVNGSVHKRYSTCVKIFKEGDNATKDFWCQNHVVKDCNFTCAQIVKKTPCKIIEGQTQLFILSSIALITYSIFFSNCYRIIDVTSMSMVKTYNSDFGRQRFWSIVGQVIFAPLSGYVITLVSPKHGPQRYDVAFYFFDAMTLLTILVVWNLDVKMDPPAKDMLKKTLGLLKNFDVIAFFTSVFVIGTAWGFTVIFSNWYLEELSAPSSLIGLIPAVNGVLGLPFLLKSKWFVTKIGSSNVLILALLGHVAFCVGYSFLRNPWWCLAYEVFGVVTYHLLWVAVVTHSHEVAPTGLTATTVSVSGGIHYGIGIGSGSLIGGVIMSKYGGRMAYRVMAAICLGASALYASYLSLRRRSTKKGLDLRRIESGKAVNYESDGTFTPQMVF